MDGTVPCCVTIAEQTLASLLGDLNEPRLAILLVGPAGSGKTTLVHKTLRDLSLVLQSLTATVFTSVDPETAIAAALTPRPHTVAFVEDLDVFAPSSSAPSALDRRVVASFEAALSAPHAPFVATASAGLDAVHPALRFFFTVLVLDALTWNERLRAVEDWRPTLSLKDAKQITDCTPGFLHADLARLFSTLEEDVPLHSALRKIRPALLPRPPQRVPPPVLYGLSQPIADLQAAMISAFSQSHRPARRVLDRLGAFRGVLIHGRTGCGKTALSRVAEGMVPEHTVNFLHVAATEVITSVVGDGERRLMGIFRTARAIAPSVIVLDNIDVIAPRRRQDEAAGGAFNRLVSILLVLIDGVAHDDRRVFVIATTRDIHLLDPALLRPGRLDLHVEVEAPNREARLEMLDAFFRKRNMTAKCLGIDINVFAVMSDGWTAADVLAYARKAILKTFGLSFT